jgi:uncharacterized glyoxalase superfamily protein PhnB
MAVVFTSLHPMLRTKDLKATIEFYTQRLGFVCEGFSAEDGWASLRRDAVEIMVATPNLHVPFDVPAFTGSLYFNVKDVATLWAQLKDVVEIAYPLETFHYGMSEFAIYDNNGYMLQFGAPATMTRSS